MGLEALQRFSDLLHQAGDQQPISMQFSPTRDGDNVARWRDMENVRYRRDGIREDIFVRGGSELHRAFDHELVQSKAFTATYSGSTKRLLALKFATGSIGVYDPDTDTLDTYFTDIFAGQHKVDFHPMARFLYVFDGVTKEYRYIDLISQTEHDWLSGSAPDVDSIEWIAEGDFSEGNVWGFRKGASIIHMPLFHSLGSSGSMNDVVIGPSVRQYTHNDGQYLVATGLDSGEVREFKRNTIIYFFEDTHLILDGSGDAPELRMYWGDIPIRDGKVDYTPRVTTIKGFEYDPEKIPAGRDNFFYVKTFSPEDTVKSAAPSALALLPNSPDLSDLLDIDGAYSVNSSNTDISSNAHFEKPTLYRSYLMAWELNDGSFVVPGAPLLASIVADNISDDHRGVKITRTGASAPDNAVKLHLFATRWQITPERCFLPSERYANGTFYHASEHDPESQEINDFTSDEELLNHISGYIPISGGVYSLFRPGQLKPNMVTSIRNGILGPGYEVARYNSGDYIREIGSGSTVSGKSIGVEIEYSDNSRSNVIVFTARDNSKIQFFGVNGLIKAFHVYLVEDGTPDVYHVAGRISNTDAEFFGLPLEVSTDTADYEDTATPDGSAENNQIRLDHYIFQGYPPQQILIPAQIEIESARKIDGVAVQGIDDDRAGAIRFIATVFTDQFPVSGFLSPRTDAQGLRFEMEQESTDRALPLRDRHGVLAVQGGFVFQSTNGLYFIQGRRVQKLLDRDRYVDLDSDIIDAVYHNQRDELHLFPGGYRVLVMPLSDEETIWGRPVVFAYPSGQDYLVSATVSGEDLFYCSGKNLVKADVMTETTDSGINGNGKVITGKLQSDHLTDFLTQLHLDSVALYGTGYEARVSVDTQEGRYDDAGGGDWSTWFTAELQTGWQDLTMRGLPLSLGRRGVAPRMRIELKHPSVYTASRLSAVELFANALAHQGANRN